MAAHTLGLSMERVLVWLALKAKHLAGGPTFDTSQQLRSGTVLFHPKRCCKSSMYNKGSPALHIAREQGSILTSVIFVFALWLDVVGSLAFHSSHLAGQAFARIVQNRMPLEPQQIM